MGRRDSAAPIFRNAPFRHRRFFASDQTAPIGVKCGGYNNPKAHALIVDDAVLVWVVTTPIRTHFRPKVKTLVQASTDSRT